MSSKSPATEIVTIELASDRSHLFGYAPSDGRKVLITTIVFPLGLIALSLLTVNISGSYQSYYFLFVGGLNHYVLKSRPVPLKLRLDPNGIRIEARQGNYSET